VRIEKNTVAAALVKGSRAASERQTTELQSKGPSHYPGEGTLQHLRVCPLLSAPVIFLTLQHPCKKQVRATEVSLAAEQRGLRRS